MSEPSVRRVLIAGRGSEALHVNEVAHRLGMETVLLIREADGDALWPDAGDFAVPVPAGPSGDWPSAESVVEQAQDAGCDAVFLGTGRLARDAQLVEALAMAGVLTLGPWPKQLLWLANAVELRNRAHALHIPVVPASEVFQEPGPAEAWVSWTGLPVVIHPAREQAGRRPTLVREAAELRPALMAALRGGPVWLERQVEGARELEVPVFGDGAGKVVVLPERDSTLRLGERPTLVESPASHLDPAVRADLSAWTTRLAEALQWRGAGYARYLLTPDGRAYLLRFRPGLGHGAMVTELVTGLDLVSAQLRLAAGVDLGWSAEPIAARGHAICLLLEGAGGAVEAVLTPEGGRLDAAVVEGDPTLPGAELGLLGARGPTRQSCIVRAKAALDHWPFPGVAPGNPALSRLFDEASFWSHPLDREAARRILTLDLA
jgi:biotin carboxylase